ncbi:MAG: S49 family peptidase [Myxococcales bacterium]|nr:S49 family peptidase [Myxococcales bacterium]
MIVRLPLNLLSLLSWILQWVFLWPFVLLRRKRPRYVAIKLEGQLTFSHQRPWFLPTPKSVTLEQLDDLVRDLFGAPSVRGLIVRLDAIAFSAAEALYITSLFKQLQALGKEVIVSFDQAGPTEMILARAADTVFMMPGGRVMLPGPAISMTHIKDLLSRIGLRAQVLRIGRFKTAMNPLIASEPTDAEREQSQRLLDDLSEALALEALGKPMKVVDGRKVWPADRPTYSIDQARREGLIDHRAYPDEVATWLKAKQLPNNGDFDPVADAVDESESVKQALEKVPTPWIQSRSQFEKTRPRQLRWRRLFGHAPVCAIVDLSGPIVDNTSTGSPLRRQAVIAPSDTGRVLKALREDPTVKCVVLSINSPGGSANASDRIWHQVKQLARKARGDLDSRCCGFGGLLPGRGHR